MTAVTTDLRPGEGPGQDLLASPVRRSLVDSLGREGATPAGPGPGLTAAQLAERVGLHVTTVRFHLDRLEAAGIVRGEFTTAFGVGRPRKVYALAARVPSEPPAPEVLAKLTGLLAESFGGHLTPEQAGAEWARHHLRLEDTGPATTAGEWLTRVGQLVDVLTQWGYTPELTTSEGGRACRIDLAHCPFHDLARANTDVVCGIHQGLLAGAMQQMGEHDVEVSLQPFAGPDLCHARVATRTTFRSMSDPHEEPV